jgi:hypothetical protein
MQGTLARTCMGVGQMGILAQRYCCCNTDIPSSRENDHEWSTPFKRSAFAARGCECDPRMKDASGCTRALAPHAQEDHSPLKNRFRATRRRQPSRLLSQVFCVLANKCFGNPPIQHSALGLFHQIRVCLVPQPGPPRTSYEQLFFRCQHKERRASIMTRDPAFLLTKNLLACRRPSGPPSPIRLEGAAAPRKPVPLPHKIMLSGARARARIRCPPHRICRQ